MTSAAAASISVQTAGRSARLWATVFAHAAVDFFSFIVVPLMSVLEGRVQMSHAQGAVILAAGSLSSGLIQPVVAWLSDRFDTRAVGTLGFLVAVIAIGLVGYAGSFNQLLLLQVLGAGGIGAFHPVAAAAVGQLAAPRRSRGVALFYAAGMVGGTLGNITAPVYVSVAGGTGRGEADTVAGLHALAWLILPGLVCVALLAWAIHSVPHRDHGAHRLHAELPAQQRRQRWRAVWLLYAGNVLRFMVDMCLIQLIIRWTEWQAMRAAGTEVLTAAIRADASHLNGPLQAAKQVGMGAGGIAMGFLLRPRHEKRVLIWVPIAGAAVVRIDSGWNCTPSMPSVLWRIPMISPSAVSALISKQSGRFLRFTMSE